MRGGGGVGVVRGCFLGDGETRKKLNIMPPLDLGTVHMPCSQLPMNCLSAKRKDNDSIVRLGLGLGFTHFQANPSPLVAVTVPPAPW
jgi:hypothetical protein